LVQNIEHDEIEEPKISPYPAYINGSKPEPSAPPPTFGKNTYEILREARYQE